MEPRLELVLEFVNTHDLESAIDELSTPAQLAAWMRANHIPADATPTEAEYRRVIELRDRLRALGEANNGGAAPIGGLAALNAAAELAPLRVEFARGAYSLEPARPGVDGVVAALLSGVAGALADGTWSRVKACRNHGCRWLFLDTSRNRSRTWCTMAICGSRMKSRAYRRRRASA
jgi:predicted RNA-binding Zn ribbon-like protein